MSLGFHNNFKTSFFAVIWFKVDRFGFDHPPFFRTERPRNRCNIKIKVRAIIEQTLWLFILLKTLLCFCFFPHIPSKTASKSYFSKFCPEKKCTPQIRFTKRKASIRKILTGVQYYKALLWCSSLSLENAFTVLVVVSVHLCDNVDRCVA